MVNAKVFALSALLAIGIGTWLAVDFGSKYGNVGSSNPDLPESSAPLERGEVSAAELAEGASGAFPLYSTLCVGGCKCSFKQTQDTVFTHLTPSADSAPAILDPATGETLVSGSNDAAPAEMKKYESHSVLTQTILLTNTNGEGSDGVYAPNSVKLSGALVDMNIDLTVAGEKAAVEQDFAGWEYPFQVKYLEGVGEGIAFLTEDPAATHDMKKSTMAEFQVTVPLNQEREYVVNEIDTKGAHYEAKYTIEEQGDTIKVVKTKLVTEDFSVVTGSAESVPVDVLSYTATFIIDKESLAIVSVNTVGQFKNPNAGDFAKGGAQGSVHTVISCSPGSDARSFADGAALAAGASEDVGARRLSQLHSEEAMAYFAEHQSHSEKTGHDRSRRLASRGPAPLQQHVGRFLKPDRKSVV